MSNRKNTGAAKSVAKAKPVVKAAGKPVVKPVANTAHNHSDLEQQILELKKHQEEVAKKEQESESQPVEHEHEAA